MVSGEGAAGAIGTRNARGEAHDEEPCVWIPPARHGGVEPIGVARLVLLPIGDEARAERAIGGRFGGLRHDDALALIGLGSNRRHGRYGRPEEVLRAALTALEAAGVQVVRVSGVYPTAPMGPGGRRFANMAVAARWEGEPGTLLGVLKQVERAFGRRRGQRWGDRVLDLDLLALGGAVVRERGLIVPHPGLAVRRFVLDPLGEVAPFWRHPVLNLTVRQLRARLLRSKRSLPLVGAHSSIGRARAF